MTEVNANDTTLLEQLQDILRGMDEFESADVVIEDWKILDQSVAQAPYAILETPDDFEADDEGNVTWQVPVTLFVRFTDWVDSLKELRQLRAAVITLVDTSSNPALGYEGIMVRRIYNDGPLAEYYDRYVEPDELASATPVFLFQRILLDVLEY